jgi:hypothetical protein
VIDVHARAKTLNKYKLSEKKRVGKTEEKKKKKKKAKKKVERSGVRRGMTSRWSH